MFIYFSDSGAISNVATAFAGMFNLTNEDSVIGFMATVTATLQEIPLIIADVGRTAVKTIADIWKMLPFDPVYALTGEGIPERMA